MNDDCKKINEIFKSSLFGKPEIIVLITKLNLILSGSTMQLLFTWALIDVWAFDIKKNHVRNIETIIITGVSNDFF